MAEKRGRPKKGAANKARRTAVLSVKLDEETRWLLEITSRSHRRTSSSFVEWCINLALETSTLRDGDEHCVSDLRGQLWDVYESDRIAKLAFLYPEILDIEEQRIWKVVCESSSFWKRYVYGTVPNLATMLGGNSSPVDANGLQWNPREQEDLLFPLVREHWETIKAVASGELDMSALPTRELDGRDHAWRKEA